ncbi:hypothetical protein BD560DRAFT_426694 [Blakeslea trispora]|nr:hypothetical protein BD560DRAFT_426694 [Blakeslea trispora]
MPYEEEFSERSTQSIYLMSKKPLPAEAVQVSKPQPALLAPSITITDSSYTLYPSSSSLVTCFDLQHNDTSKPQITASPESMLLSKASDSLIQTQSQEIEGMRKDLMKLNQKYVLQIERTQTAEQAHHQMEAELEDLSLRLFEQANGMVSEERKKRFDAERRVTQLESKLVTTIRELAQVKAQLKELRARLEPQGIEDEVMLRNTKPSFIMPCTSITKDILPHHLDNLCTIDQKPIASKNFLALASTAPSNSLQKLVFGKYLSIKRKNMYSKEKNKFSSHIKYTNEIDEQEIL